MRDQSINKPQLIPNIMIFSVMGMNSSQINYTKHSSRENGTKDMTSIFTVAWNKK